jgi:hypothetical protein
MVNLTPEFGKVNILVADGQIRGYGAGDVTACFAAGEPTML